MYGSARIRRAFAPRVKATGKACAAAPALRRRVSARDRETSMSRIVWLVGAVVIVLFLLSFLGLR
jgi:type VI protein secretion system component VasF